MASVLTLQAGARKISVNDGLFIDGEFVPSVSGKKFAVVNPSTGDKVCEVFEGAATDVDKAVAAAKKAFPAWRRLPSRDRATWMRKIVEELEAHADDIAHLESLDNGKPLKDARAVDVPMLIETFRFYASFADKLEGATYETEWNDMSFTRREPIGVCGAIIPWNFPILMLAWKTAPALACGNTQVLKSSEKTPLSALYFAQLMKNIGLPEGVFNLVSGFGPEVGAPLAAHQDVRKIGFTGSVPTARRIMALAAESNLKKVTLELGGKSPNIIFDDADLDLAVASATAGIYFNHGQVCSAGSRIFVQEGIYDEFVKRFVVAAGKIRLGDQFGENTDQGPQVDEIQFNKILGYVEEGKKEGATVACGGTRVGDKGYFIAPTLLTGCQDTHKVVREEIFGPVGVCLKFSTEEEVIERANNSNYGLAAALFTTNLSRAFRVEKALEAGSVWVNCYNKFDVRIPFGGYKESGFGREMSSYAIDSFTQIKAVRITL
eukprot:TRINITY_DN9513_c0_g1_i2.p1 TRINITY_DN9513_c0_g1~~TRINITY_DN9513_c0_g1_i2.p1  ORF type:complete len:491 (+),score=116.74 TRINITY_DN9513_c0_g1_i2:66-1538(+)